MPESTVHWRKENLRYGLVRMQSMTYQLTSKILIDPGGKNMACLQSTVPFVFKFSFFSFGTTFPYSLYLSAAQCSHNVRGSYSFFRSWRSVTCLALFEISINSATAILKKFCFYHNCY